MVVCKMGLALLAAKDLIGGEIDVVRETHGGCSMWICWSVGFSRVTQVENKDYIGEEYKAR